MLGVVSRLSLLTLALTLGDCTPSSPGEHDVKNTSANDDSTQGPYDGVLPCADCGGIRTRLTLHLDRATGRPTRYEATETYLATKDGDRTFDREGRWAIMRGNADDPDATIYQLDHDKPQALRNFLRVGDGELRLLDRDQRDIPSLTPHSLFRAPDGSLAAATVFGEQDAGRSMEVAHGRVFVIRLEGNRSTGFQWSLAPLAATGALSAIGGATYVAPSGASGAGGSESFAFRATQRGSQELRFEYRRPWERNVAPARSLTYTIVVP